MTTDSTRKVILGKIIGLSGVRGWVKVHSDTVPRKNIVSFKRWNICPEDKHGGSNRQGFAVGSGSDALQNAQNKSWEVIEIEGGREQGKTVIAKIHGIEDRETAAKLVGSVVAVDRSELPALAEDEYYWADLIDFDVRDTSDKSLGRVQRLFATGANDVMVVEGESEILIPWIRGSVVMSIDMEGKTILVDWDPDY